VQPNTLEAGLAVVFACARVGVDLIILDSVGAGVPKQLQEQAIAEKGNLGRVGMVAAVWSSVLPQLASDVASSGSHVMGLSQLRKNINTTGYGENTTHQGGDAWKFYSAVRMSFRRVQSIKTKDYDALTHKQIERATSAIIRATVKKSKISNSQQREADFHITFGEGIDNARDLITVGSAHGIVVKAGSWLQFERGDGTMIKSQGVPAFRHEILTAAGAYEELTTKVLGIMKAGGTGSLLAVADAEDDVGDDVGFVSE
jgi:recombination protein RecA